MFSSPLNIPDRERCRPAPLLNTDKGQLCQIWSSLDAKQVERHHFYRLHFRCAKFTFFQKLQLFDSEFYGRLSINNSLLL